MTQSIPIQDRASMIWGRVDIGLLWNSSGFNCKIIEAFSTTNKFNNEELRGGKTSEMGTMSILTGVPPPPSPSSKRNINNKRKWSLCSMIIQFTICVITVFNIFQKKAEVDHPNVHKPIHLNFRWKLPVFVSQFSEISFSQKIDLILIAGWKTKV